MNEKNKNLFKHFILVFSSMIVLTACESNTKSRLVNDSHLNYLYEEIVINEIEMAIIHIYSEYPNYDWVTDPDEGNACVDDVARAAIFYFDDYNNNNNVESRIRGEKLIRFILFMQSDNGYFYNFIFPDHTVNTEHKNSINRPGWWSWRALWALTKAYPIFAEINTQLSKQILEAVTKVTENIKAEFPNERDITIISGIELPQWLPYNYASDQAALLILGLIDYYNITSDESVLATIRTLAEGIMMMQVTDPESDYYGAFLSWQTKWHGWGNAQSYSLLKAYQLFGDKEYLEKALLEIDNFYKNHKTTNLLSEFSISKVNDQIKVVEFNQYSQIAYILRPMIYSTLEAFKITENKKYKEQAIQISKWFFGENHLKTQMYYPETGICYDGLNETFVNKNSGAESTIEALLSFQALKKYGIGLTHIIE